MLRAHRLYALRLAFAIVAGCDAGDEASAERVLDEKPGDTARDAQAEDAMQPGDRGDAGRDERDPPLDAAVSAVTDSATAVGDASTLDPELPDAAKTDAASAVADDDAGDEPSMDGDGDAEGDADRDGDGDGANDALEQACGTAVHDASDRPEPTTLRGHGTAEGPYLLCLPAHLSLWLSLGELASHARVTRDLELDHAPITVQLGTEAAPFEGTLEGGGHVLHGLMLGTTERALAGMIGALASGGVVRELRVSGGRGHAGALVTGRNAGLLERIEVAATSQGSDHLGLLANYNLESGRVVECASAGRLTAERSHIGGLVGENHGLIQRSHSSVEVRGDNRSGGLVGSGAGTLDQCYATGTVFGARSFIGGLLGTALDGANVRDSYALGAVTSSAGGAGGLVGSTQGSCRIERSYAANLVSGATGAHGILGIDESMGGAQITACYFDSSLTAADPLATPLSAAAMHEASAFAGFDFTAPVWTLAAELQSTPALSYQRP